MAKDDGTMSDAEVDEFLKDLDTDADEAQASEPGTDSEAPAEAEAQATDGEGAAASEPESTESPDQPAADAAPSSADTTPPDTSEAAPAGSEPEPSADGEDKGREPFTVNVYGQPLEIPGAYREKDRKWVRVPVESWERVIQPRLVEPRVIQEREMAHRRELQQAREAQSLVDTQAKGLLDRFSEIVKLAETDPAASLAKWEETVAEFPQFLLRQEKEYWERQAKQPNAEAEQRQRQEQSERIDTEVRTALQGYADEALKLDAYKEVGPAMRDDLVKALHRARFNLVYATGEKDPASGLPKLDIRWELFKEIVEDVASVHRRYAQQIKTVQEAARKNAARQTPKPVAPPAPGAPRAPAPSGKKIAGTAAKTWDEIEAAAAEINLDD